MCPATIVLGHKPNVSHFQPIGCRAYVLRKDLKRADKAEFRTHIGYLLGYDSTNTFRIWVPKLNRVIRTRDVLFDRNHMYKDDERQSLTTEERDYIEVLDIPAPEERVDVDELLHLFQARQHRLRKQHEQHNTETARRDENTQTVAEDSNVVDNSDDSMDTFTDEQELASDQLRQESDTLSGGVKECVPLLSPPTTCSSTLEPDQEPRRAQVPGGWGDEDLQEQQETQSPPSEHQPSLTAVPTRRTNTAPRRNEIDSNFSAENILNTEGRSTRSRVPTNRDDNQQRENTTRKRPNAPETLLTYYSTFFTQVLEPPQPDPDLIGQKTQGPATTASKPKLHRERLSPLPDRYKDVWTHEFCDEWKIAMQK